MSTRFVVGLGNPGAKYESTWHNAGFWIVNRFAIANGWEFRPGRGDYWYCRAQHRGDTIVLVKPTTYMNLSGHAVVDVLNFFNGRSDELLVIFDDHDLPLGTLRLRSGGSDGGHKGIRSIIECIGDDRIPRLRFGIRPPDGRSGDLANKVLRPVPEEQTDTLEKSLSEAVSAVECVLTDGLLAAMNQYNRKPKPSKPAAAKEPPSDQTQTEAGK